MSEYTLLPAGSTAPAGRTDGTIDCARPGGSAAVSVWRLGLWSAERPVGLFAGMERVAGVAAVGSEAGTALGACSGVG